MTRLLRVAEVGAFAGALASAGGLLLASGVPICQFARFTGCPCPGCGLTRSTLAIARGELAFALQVQPFAFVVTPLLALCALVLARAYVTGRALALSPRDRAGLGLLFATLVVSMTVFWVARFYGFWNGPVAV